jgi:hypothetical protein
MRIACVSEIAFLVAAAVLLLSPMDARAQSPTPANADTYLPVEDLPPPRTTPAMTADERVKLKKELTAARVAKQRRLKPEIRAATNEAGLRSLRK